MNWKEKLKKINSKFYINNNYPNYINKWIFKIAFVFIVLGVFYVAYVDDLTLKPSAFIECKSELKCHNTFYSCQNQTQIIQEFMFVDCEPYNKVNCANNVCEREYLDPHESLGKEPSELYKKFPLYVFMFISISFLINHIIWWRRK